MDNLTISFLLLFCFNLYGLHGQQYSTNIDKQLARPFSIVRKSISNLTANRLQINKIYHQNKKLGKIQPYVPLSQLFYCDVKNAPVKRSLTPPESVNEVRPGDIDIIAAIGDSLTAANGAISTDLFNLVNENRGLSWSIGGRDEWRKYITLPNMLREFNSNLYGYATEDSMTVDRASKFNVAEPMTRYEDMLYQTKVLFKRMQRDPKVNMTSHWKLITIFLGNNDQCAKLCEMQHPDDYVNEHIKYVYETLRFLRENIPRTIINWVMLPNLIKLRAFKNVPMQCYIASRIECRCIYSSEATPAKLKKYENIVLKMQKVQKEIVSKDEFHSNTFTVNLQPFTLNWTTPILPNGDTDLRYFASDCFHFSQLGQASAANALWNNLMQPEGRKQVDWQPALKRFECPTNENPFIATRENKK